jgi:hypothetical protein
MKLEKYSFGVGDRFANQGIAQLTALVKAKQKGLNIVPVWNKSNREHEIIHSEPSAVRIEADNAVRALNWQDSYYVDADHINLNTVDKFLDSSDFFTIDVADYIGKPTTDTEIQEFITLNKKYLGELRIPGIKESFTITEQSIQNIANKFLFAIKEASKIYHYIANKKGTDKFIPEVSMDEVEQAQSPIELFFILSGLAHFGVPAQTIAPKFTGRFNKGVDYVGDINQFAKEFEQDLLVINYAIQEFNLPNNLKLSVHSGSDKFAIYPIMGKLIKKHNAGIHVKTAGTTWLEEIIGLALADSEALKFAKAIYEKAYHARDELCKPYATIIDINNAQLPTPQEVNNWKSEKFVNSLRHIQTHPDYNPNFRQLIHVAYKIAAEYGNVYIQMLKKYNNIIGQQITENIYQRHIKRLFNLET